MRMQLAVIMAMAVAFAALAGPAAARLSYGGLETTINEDFSCSVKATLKFSEPETAFELMTSLPVKSLKTSGNFGPVACDTKVTAGESVITCSLSGITREKNTLYLEFETEAVVNYSYGRYHFSEVFIPSLQSDKLFSMVKLPESATLADYPPENSYIPSNGTTITDGRNIMVIWDSSGIPASERLEFGVEYNLPPIRGSVTRYILIGAGIVIIIVIVAAFIYTRRASKVNKGRVIASVLNADEKRLIDIIAGAGGKALQKQTVRESGFSKAKVSRLVKSLGGRGIIKVEPVSGRENRIILSGGSGPTPEKEQKNEEENPGQAGVAEGRGA